MKARKTGHRSRFAFSMVAGSLLAACAAPAGQDLAPAVAESGPTGAPVESSPSLVAIEFVMSRTGGLCVTKQGGTLCTLRLVVRDDGTWEATGVLPPAPAEGSVENGAASRLAALVEEGWELLTAHPFTGTCPSAYDGQELVYEVRRIPAGPDAERADADVRELRGCTYDLDHPEARAVLERLEALWRKLGLP